MIEQQLYSTLSSDVDLSAVVGTKIFPVVIPQNTQLPAISYQVISADLSNNLAFENPNITFKRIQVNGWAKTYAGCKDLEVKIKDALHNGSIKAKVESIRDDVDSELQEYGIIMDIIVQNK